MKKQVLTIFLAVCAFLLLLAALWFLNIYRPGDQVMAPPILNKKGVVKGAGAVDKKLFAADKRLDAVTDIRYGRFLKGSGDVIAAVSPEGAVYFGADGKVLRTVSFAAAGYGKYVRLAGRPENHSFLVFRTDEGYAASVGRDGKERWRFKGPESVMSASAGDIDGDGRPEFALGFNGGGGVYLLDFSGKELWRGDGSNIWGIALARMAGEKGPRIVHTDAGGMLTIRAADGKVVRSAKAEPGYAGAFSMTPWPGRSGEPHPLFLSGDALWVLDAMGKAAGKLPAPGCGSAGRPSGLPVRLGSSPADYFAALLEYPDSASVLFIYDPSGALIYQEVLPGRWASIAAFRAAGDEADTLLVGGPGEIWKYSLAASMPGGEPL